MTTTKWQYNLIHTGDHILGVYPNKEMQFEAALEFLKNGLHKNETAMLVTDAFSKKEILKKMSYRWNTDVNKLEFGGDVIIKSTRNWFFPNDSVDESKIKARWSDLIDYSRYKERNGLRVFEDTSSFFKHGLVKDLINYESTLSERFGYPITVMCGYVYEEIDSLTAEQFRVLQKHHSLVWM